MNIFRICLCPGFHLEGVIKGRGNCHDVDKLSTEYRRYIHLFTVGAAPGVHIVLNRFTGESGGSPSLRDVMTFLTECDSVPPLGFGSVSPSIQFSETAVWPTVSTCALSLTFQLNFPTNPVLFKDFSILGSQGYFGQV